MTRRLGLAFPDERLPDLERALDEVTASLRLRSPRALLTLLAESPERAPAWSELVSRVTVKETYFFRDEACFRALEHAILPGLVAARRQSGRLCLRLWSAGCATGEEAYSLAILVDRLLPQRQAWDVTILATDIDVKALAAARGGRYRAWSLRETPRELRELCFAPRSSGEYELDPRLRRLVSLEAENLSSGGPRGPMDLILCRNALMYLEPPAARAAVERLSSSLAEDGWLALAPAEASAERLRPLVQVSFPGTLFFRRPQPVASAARRAGRLGLDEAAARRARPPSRRTAAPPRVHERGAPEPPSVADRIARARACADRGALEEALALCREALAKDRLVSEAHRLIGEVQQEQGDLEAAARALRRAVYLDPDSAEAHAALGQLLTKRGDRRRGEKHLETAARLARRTGAQ